MDQEELRIRVESALASLAYLPIDVTVDDNIVYLSGTVRSGEEKELAARLARQVKGVRSVVDKLTIGEVAPVNLEREGEPYRDAGLQEVNLDQVGTGEDVEPDFVDSIGTTDVMESTSENEPFFPPTDPVVVPTAREKEGIKVIGGFAPTADDNLSEPLGHPPKIYQTDDELAEDVQLALLRDASTSNLDIRVLVRNGIVYLRGRVQSLEDVEQAEAVASSVPGVVEVREELEY